VEEVAMTWLSRIAIVAVAILTSHSIAFAQPSDARVDWSTKRVAFEMRGKPWAQVFEWFVDQTGMPFRSKYPPPAGTFNFINPKDPKTGKPREYTLNEVYDTINEFLQAEHKFTLLRSDTTLTMIPADEPIPPGLVPRVTLDELPRRSRTEIVEIVLKLKDDRARSEMRSGFDVPMTSLGDGRYLVRSDVKSLRRFLDTLPPASDTPMSSTTPPPVSQSPPAAACCGSAPRCRAGLLARLLRR
jgi:hypothetical protein